MVRELKSIKPCSQKTNKELSLILYIPSTSLGIHEQKALPLLSHHLKTIPDNWRFWCCWWGFPQGTSKLTSARCGRNRMSSLIEASRISTSLQTKRLVVSSGGEGVPCGWVQGPLRVAFLKAGCGDGHTIVRRGQATGVHALQGDCIVCELHPRKAVINGRLSVWSPGGC